MSHANRTLAVIGIEFLFLLVICYADHPRVEANDSQTHTALGAQGPIIAYTSPQPETDSNSEVWIMGMDGSNQTQLTTHIGDDRWSAISPDGSQIAYVSFVDKQSSTLWIMNRDGSNSGQLPVGGNTQRLAWSPTGSQIAITNDAVDWWEIWLVNPDGSNLHRLTTNNGAAGNPSWAPDEQKIIYSAESSTAFVDLYLVNSDGTGQTLFISASGTGFSNQMPAWSPDGAQIATIRWPAGNDGPYNLWLMNADGSSGTVLVQNVDRPYLNRISWSPDGNWLVFAKNGQIWRVQRDGTQLTQITTTGGWEPSIGPGSAACIPQANESDIALVVDRSGSMGNEHKLDNAKIAITTFISATQAPPDQLALVSFSSDARLDQPLTTDKTALISAAQALTTTSGTRIDLGLFAARTELTSTRHLSTHAKIIILLTDGRQSPAGDDPVIAEANAAKAEGAILYTIGLGSDVDAALLQQIATSPDHYYFAPTSADLEGIYQQISASIICPDIGGKVYVDQDNNGLYTPGVDAPLPNVTVKLSGPTNGQTASQIDGSYLFADNLSGTYTVSLVLTSVLTSYLPISPTLHVVNLTSLDSLDNNFGVRAQTARADVIVFTYPQPANGLDPSLNTNIWIMNADGSDRTPLTTYSGMDRQPALSPDGSKVAYISFQNSHDTLWVMNSDGSDAIQLPISGSSAGLAWSPTGNQIAFGNDSVDWWEIWIINADGANLRRITTHGPAAGHPSWSPDGQRLVYSVNSAAGYMDLYRVNTDGTGQSLLMSSSTGFSYHYTAWSPDGTQIAAVRWPSGSNGPYDLWVMNADGSNGNVIVQAIEYPDQNLTWSLNSHWLVFGKGGQIWRVRRDGSELTQITAAGGWEPATNANGFDSASPLKRIYLPVLQLLN